MGATSPPISISINIFASLMSSSIAALQRSNRLERRQRYFHQLRRFRLADVIFGQRVKNHLLKDMGLLGRVLFSRFREVPALYPEQFGLFVAPSRRDDAEITRTIEDACHAQAKLFLKKRQFLGLNVVAVSPQFLLDRFTR